jgi:CO/xanthine dehydrogenase FAD-binding subunit
VLQHVFVPTDIGDAIQRLSEGPDAALLAGGTLLMPVVDNEATELRALVSMRRLPLGGIAVKGEKVTIGAATTLSAVGDDQRLAFLKPVIESIASPLIRNLATVGGNLFAPQPYGDLAVALLALDAKTTVLGPEGERQVAVADILEQGVGAADIVTEVAFTRPTSGSWFYTKAMRRKMNSASIVTVAAVVTTEDGVVNTARIALGGAGPRPVRAVSVERALVGKALTPEAVMAAAEKAGDDADPFSDAYASAWYRARVMPVHIRRAILGE